MAEFNSEIPRPPVPEKEYEPKDAKIRALELRVEDLVKDNQAKQEKWAAADFRAGKLALEVDRKNQEIETLKGEVAAEQYLSQKKNILVKELLNQATEDGLTKLPNTRSFFDGVENRRFQDRRKGELVPKNSVVVSFDANGFKLINDGFGHLAGNRALQSLARRVRELCEQKGGMVGRVGGDEFAAYFPEASSVEEIQALFPRNANGDPEIVVEYTVSDQDTDPKVFTASVGVALVPPQDDFFQSYENADKEMYKAKHKGGTTSEER